MPVLEFALDGTPAYHVQVHITAHQGPISVMLNHHVLGSLTTVDEQAAGKDFRLPDSSILRLCYIHGHLQAWRNGSPLALTGGSGALTEAESELDQARLGGCATSLLVLNMLISGGLTIWFLLISPFLSHLALDQFGLGLISLVGLIGLFALLGWRRWGFYLATLSVLANIVFGFWLATHPNFLMFLPIFSLVALFWYFYTSGIWHSMRR